MEKKAAAKVKNVVTKGKTAGRTTEAKTANNTLSGQAAQLISGLFTSPKPKRRSLWLCIEENARGSTARLVVATSKDEALHRFRSMEGVQGWGAYEATEIVQVDGYRVVLQPITNKRTETTENPKPTE